MLGGGGVEACTTCGGGGAEGWTPPVGGDVGAERARSGLEGGDVRRTTTAGSTGSRCDGGGKCASACWAKVGSGGSDPADGREERRGGGGAERRGGGGAERRGGGGAERRGGGGAIRGTEGGRGSGASAGNAAARGGGGATRGKGEMAGTATRDGSATRGSGSGAAGPCGTDRGRVRAQSLRDSGSCRISSVGAVHSGSAESGCGRTRVRVTSSSDQSGVSQATATRSCAGSGSYHIGVRGRSRPDRERVSAARHAYSGPASEAPSEDPELVGRTALSSPQLPFRSPPEKVVRVDDYVPCASLDLSKHAGNVEAALRAAR
jgi:hypothetical protein